MEVYLSPIAGRLAQLPIFIDGISLFSMKDYAPFCFFKELGFNGFVFVLQVSYLQ